VAPTGNPSASDKVYHPTKLAAVVDMLVVEGVPVEEALRGVGVTPGELHSPGALVSIEQVLAACRNAIRFSGDPALAFRIGLSMHVSVYGMYGYAILCGADFRKTMSFCVKYHVLATPLVDLSFAERDGTGIWTIDPIVHASADDRLYRFIVEMQIGLTLSLMRDVMGPSFTPREIDLAYARSKTAPTFDSLKGTSARFSQPANRFVFDAKWLDAAAELGNRTTYAVVVALCDELLSDLALRTGPAGRIRASILEDISARPSLPVAARRLGTTPRTLRRQLAQQGTSFRALVDELKAQVAMKYLRETAMTNDDIAAALGFSDAANFRHAFRRWTGKSPRAFRSSRLPPFQVSTLIERAERGRASGKPHPNR
jgi:AraC-like DNA-binding protein